MDNNAKEKSYKFQITSILMLGCILTAYAMYQRVEAVIADENRNTAIRTAAAAAENTSGGASRGAGLDYPQGLYPALPRMTERGALQNGW